MAFDDATILVAGKKDNEDDDYNEATSTTCCSESFVVGARFNSLGDAKETGTLFAKCPLRQYSTQKHAYIVLKCFRGAVFEKMKSEVDASQRRKTPTRKCNCAFTIRLRKVDDTEQYQVYFIDGTHNHELYSEDELASLRHSRFIPDEVARKMIELNSLGGLKTKQIVKLIAEQFFPQVAVTWNTRDVQNLLQSVTRSHEAYELIDLLKMKQTEEEQLTSMHLNPDSFRLERVLWI
jgi:hypothetical protein